jgi:hypothetical protein
MAVLLPAMGQAQQPQQSQLPLSCTRGGLQRAVEARLAEIGCPVPAGLAVDVSFLDEAADELAGGRPYALLCERRTAAHTRPPGSERQDQTTEAQTLDPPQPARARLVVVKGETVDPTVDIVGERVNVGRQAEVLDRDHRVVRRNQLVFTDTDAPVNQTVSRQQAHIRRTAAGEYRIFDDHSTYGTRVFRAGRTMELPSGSPKGLRLEDGDEIYFGQACVRFEIVDGE